MSNRGMRIEESWAPCEAHMRACGRVIRHSSSVRTLVSGSNVRALAVPYHSTNMDAYRPVCSVCLSETLLTDRKNTAKQMDSKQDLNKGLI